MTDTKTLKVGSRESELAMIQTNMIIKKLKEKYPELKTKIVTFKTKGDKILDVALSKIGGKSLFTKELEVALLAKEVDFVVHSLKDLPTILPEELVIGAVCQREDPRDVVVLSSNFKNKELKMLPPDSLIGTSSLRRTAQLKRMYPHLKFESIRGNLNTRLRKLDEGEKYAGIILAAAGVLRMGWKDRISEYLEGDKCLYAVGQGALAIECREEDFEMQSLLEPLNHKETLFRVSAERALMRKLEGGCSAPLAVQSKISEDLLTLKAGVWSLDGTKEIVSSLSRSLCIDEQGESKKITVHKAKSARSTTTYCGLLPSQRYRKKVCSSYQVGVDLAKEMLEKGARDILMEAKEAAFSTSTNGTPTTKDKVQSQDSESHGTINPN